MVTKISSKEKNLLEKLDWFKKHWIISIFLGLIAIGFINGIINGITGENSDLTGNVVNEPTPEISKVQVCNPNWQCEGWSECGVSGIQRRTCKDINECGVNTNKPVESQNCNYQYKLGDKVIVGSIAYTLHGKTEKSEIGEYYGYGDYENFLGEKADGIFYVFDITIENVGKESITFWQMNLKIYDTSGRTFDPDTTAQIYLDDSFGYDQLQPGLPKRGKLVFDVPKELKGKLEVSSDKLFSDEKKYIKWD